MFGISRLATGEFDFGLAGHSLDGPGYDGGAGAGERCRRERLWTSATLHNVLGIFRYGIDSGRDLNVIEFDDPVCVIIGA